MIFVQGSTRDKVISDITNLKKRKYDDLSCQRHSGVRRNVYQTALGKTQKGELVDLNTLPLVSQAKKNQVPLRLAPAIDNPTSTNEVCLLLLNLIYSYFNVIGKLW